MKIWINCPHCDHKNRVDAVDRNIHTFCCDGSIDGGCGQLFAYQIKKIDVATYREIQVRK